jgi:site-specific DNA recombinase
MDEDTCGPRVKALRHEIEQLKGRRDEITDTVDAEPTAPPASTIDTIRTYLGHLIAEGTSAERKAAIEALIAEIRITDERIIPVFKIPGPDTALPDDTPATGTTEEAAVRAMLRSVDRRLQHTNRYATALTCSFLLPLARERRVAAS